MATKYEMSKTYQYRKVMKPQLERKRRARINKCLDDLKDLMAQTIQTQSGNSEDSTIKLEKADILEITVQHLRKLKAQRQQKQQIQPQTQQQQQQQNTISGQHSFRYGYIQAANEVSRCLASLPRIDVDFGTKLMTHLGLRLNQLESNPQMEFSVAVTSPLSVNCSTSKATISSAPMYSPVSSGYASDSESSRHASPLPSQPFNNHINNNNNKGLLQVAAPVWRPW